jgi:hypothetical protein
MSGFSFDATAGASQSTATPRLQGNEIYTVALKECVIEDIQKKDDPSKIFKVLKIKFGNEDGTFEHTVFEPNEDKGDFKRGETNFTNKNGNVEKISQPSQVESMMLLFKHIIDGFVPEIGKEIDNGTRNISAKNWDGIRLVVKKVLDLGIGNENKVKLVKDKNGEARFPGFFTGLSKEGKAYVRNNFVGPKIAFTSYELKRINSESTANPSKITDLSMDLKNTDIPSDDVNLDLNFDDITLD